LEYYTVHANRCIIAASSLVFHDQHKINETTVAGIGEPYPSAWHITLFVCNINLQFKRVISMGGLSDQVWCDRRLESRKLPCCHFVYLLFFCFSSGSAFTVAPNKLQNHLNGEHLSTCTAYPRRCSTTVLRADNAENEDRFMDEYERQSQAFTPRQSEGPSSAESTTSSSFSGRVKKRVKTKLDRLFSGMPSLGDMFRADEMEDDDDADEEEEGKSENAQSNKIKRGSSDADDTWFQSEKQQIVSKYDAMLQEMVEQLERQRREDPESVPDNARALMTSILKEELEKEVIETREVRASERISTYGVQILSDAENKELSEVAITDELQQLIDATEDDYERRERTRLRRDEFLEYEREAKGKILTGESGVAVPESGTNMDLWAVDRLERLIAKKKDEEGSEAVLDILELNVEDLKSRLQNEKEKGSIQPETMKEWQMYRAIAARLANDDKLLGTSEDAQARERRIVAQLESWKAYIQKEAQMREESGLARGPRLPFDWQEERVEKKPDVSPQTDTLSPMEMRKEINRMSIQAMESLILTADSSRRDRLQKEVDYLKSTLEANDYLDVDESYFDTEEGQMPAGPVDLTDVFAYSKADASSFKRLGKDESFQIDDVLDGPPRTVPDTPFFRETDTQQPPPPPPNTPFFSQDIDDAAPVDSKLGDFEEQKLQSMFRRAGARTSEEQEQIRKQYYEFKALENAARQKSGLGDTSSSEIDNADIDLSKFIGDDGEIDAEKILQSIGPRPSRAKKTDTPTDPSPTQVSADERVLFDSLYRSVSAVGGGRNRDDPEADARDRNAFNDLMRKEIELRKSLDEGGELPVVNDMEGPTSLDDVEYAEKVLAALGPRPKVKRFRAIDEGDFSDQGGVLSRNIDEDIEDDDDDDDREDSYLEDVDADTEDIPQWLRDERKEASLGLGRKLQGGDINDAFDDDQYEKNLRQLREYERRRAGKRQMGIDISDVLSRSRESADYVDYKSDDDYLRTRQSEWGEASFSARKESLLDYIELDLMGLNSLMDHKDSVYSTGVSQYLARVNKPFSAFGAIFRLEGVLVDITELQMKAWSIVAANLGFKEPAYDDVKRAAVLPPNVAVREVFAWGNDVLLIREVEAAHRNALRAVFDEWQSEQGIATTRAPETDKSKLLAIGSEVLEERSESSVLSDASANNELIGSSSASWLMTAEVHNRRPPSQDDLFHAASLTPDIAVIDAFGWTSDPDEASKIADTYKSCIQNGQAFFDDLEREIPIRATEPLVSVASTPAVITEDEMMEIHYYAWQNIAETFGVEPPVPDDVCAAFVINNPAFAVAEVFGWTDDQEKLKEIESNFYALVSESVQKIRNTIQKDTNTLLQAPQVQTLQSSSSLQSAQTEDTVKAAGEAWSAVGGSSVATTNSGSMCTVAPGAAKWVESLVSFEMSCGVVSFLDSEQVDALLRYAGLDKLLPPDRRVTATNGYKDVVQQLLGAALRVERRPDHCVIFDSSPCASKAAIENDMRNVNLIGPFPKYEMLSADSTASSFDELNAMNIRRLFGERIYDQPQTESLQPLVSNNRRQTITQTDFQDDD
jgi:beta-phosphoglucomutase-like phosphatase (HAD superfamily)